MDYSTLSLVQTELGSDGTTYTGANSLLSDNVTTASRWLDTICSNGRLDATDYLKIETKNETYQNVIVDKDGNMQLFPHKPVTTAVASFQWRENPRMPWRVADASMIEFQSEIVKLWNSGASQGLVTVSMTYTGGLATSQPDLPSNIVKAVSFMAARLYRRAKSGLTDVVGIADTGILFYQKEIPADIHALIQPFIRVVPW